MAEVAEDTTVAVETETARGLEKAGWGEMNAEERTSYLAGLRQQVDADKQEPTAPSKPARTRDAETGQFVSTKPPEQEQAQNTSARGDESSAAGDAVSTTSPPEKGKPKGEETADWRDDEVRSLVAAYGIDEGDLAAIPSREVLDVLLKGIERHGAQAPQGQAKTGQSQQPVGSETAQSEKLEDVIARLEALKFEEQLGADDGPKVAAMHKDVTALLKQLPGLLAWQQQQRQAEMRQIGADVRRRAVESLHKLGYADLYGESDKKPTADQSARIEQVLRDHFELGARLESQGGKPQPTPELLKRSVFALHGEQIIESAKKQQLDKLKAQSARRTGGGSASTIPPAKGATPLERNMARLGQTLRAIGAVE